MTAKIPYGMDRRLHVCLTREQDSKLCRIAGKLSLSGQGTVVRMLIERCDEQALVEAVTKAVTGGDE